MIRVNGNYLKLAGNYLFSEVANRVAKYQEENPGARVIRLGIGDVTEPFGPVITGALRGAVDEMSRRGTFQGYRSDKGYEFLREKIAQHDFLSRGVAMDPEEIFISTGAKEDTANIQELFHRDTRIAVPDPVYPVYVDSNVMAGRTGGFSDGRYGGITYLDCTGENSFRPDLPDGEVDLIYLCFPNNPTGQVATKDDLKKWVDYAKTKGAVILYDAAYEAFIRDDALPHSIFEVPGAREVAIEFRSLSKTAGFTGTRLSYTIIPRELRIPGDDGGSHSLNQLWDRRQSTKFNGVAYIIQRGAEAVFTEEGRREIEATIGYYLENAAIIRRGLEKNGIEYTGGVHSPYIWLRAPGGLSSWEFFHRLLDQCQVVGTPGAGFGRCGEGFFRLTAFGSRENVIEAMERFSRLK
ncbi:MAG: LL-diaminopimelate aminotransferase [Spirochaetes bacterium]|nr:LL-diaminopimelate aminotransferase [Spirochaetota bacterium]